MNLKVGIWIDHRKAVIVSASAERLTSMTLESGAGPTGCCSGDAEHHTAQGGEGQKRHEHHVAEHLDRYYNEIVGQLGQPEALLIFGPGEAKLQLRERLSRSQTLSACLVGVETTDTLTDPQIVAKVRQHYGIAPPGPGVNRSRTQ
jgi:hypothetical protein